MDDNLSIICRFYFQIRTKSKQKFLFVISLFVRDTHCWHSISMVTMMTIHPPVRLFLFLILFFSSKAVDALYSINFRSKGLNINGNYQILVNGTVTSTSAFTATSTGSWIDFSASLYDEINVIITGVSAANQFRLYYLINNESNGNGLQVYDSRSATFLPKNNCPSGECTFTVTKPEGNNYGSFTVSFYNQNDDLLLNYNGVGEGQFVASSTDSIRSVFSLQSSGTALYMYNLAVDGGASIGWYYSAYGTNALIANDQTPSVSFVLPQDGDVIGTSVPIKLSSAPNTGAYSVILTCNSGIPSTRIIYSNTANPQIVSIPTGLNGPCTFSISSPISGSNTVAVTVLISVTFVQPSSTSWPANSQIPVLLGSIPSGSSGPVTVTQVCGESTTSYNATVGVQFDATPPTNYVGQCVFRSMQNDEFRSAIRSVSLRGEVTISEPIDGALIPAGSFTPIYLTSTPSSGTFTVQLTCVNGFTVSNIVSNVAQEFFIASDFFGIGCQFSVTAPLNFWVVQNTVRTTVTQSVTFDLPQNVSSVEIDAQIPVKLASEASSNVIRVTVNQDCGGEFAEYENIVVGSPFSATPPTGFSGVCTFNSTANRIFQASTVNPVVFVGSVVYFLSPSDGAIIPANSVYEIQLASEPTSGTFTVQLDCGSGMVTSNDAITSNIPQSFAIPFYFSGSNCVFSVTAPLDQWTVLNPVTVEIVKFAAPIGGNLYPITDQEAAEFAKSIAIGQGSIINFD
jgi:hypothetical protein